MNEREDQPDPAERARAELQRADGEDDETRLRVLNELYAALEAEVDRPDFEHGEER